MNLQALAAPYAAAVNPPIVGTWYQSTGSAVAADGTETPAFATVSGVSFQVQALTAMEVQHLDRLNIQGIMRAVYMNGNAEGLDRNAGKGGDVLLFDGSYWLVTQVLDTWDTSGWCRLAVTLQNGKPAGLP